MIVAVVALATTSSLVLARTASASDTQTLQQRMLANLNQSGFSDVQVAPGSFYVSAKDQDGNPVSMFITPNSMAEVTTVAMNNDQPSPSSASTDNGLFVRVPRGEELSSKIIGTDVYNQENKNIGKITDIAIDNNRQVTAYVLSVGGFLGIDTHYVAVKPSAIDLSYDNHKNAWSAKIDTDASKLKAAPEYNYPAKA
jgi:hypothetical protein